jgi:hypothetical protein
MEELSSNEWMKKRVRKRSVRERRVEKDIPNDTRE